MKTEQFVDAMGELEDRYLLEAMNYQKHNIVPFRRHFPIWAAACLALVLILPVSAEIFYGTISSLLSPVFGGKESSLVEELGTPIGESVTIGDYTLTAEAAIGDRYNVAIVYSLMRTDGEPMEQNLCFQRWSNNVLPHAVPNSRITYSEDGRIAHLVQQYYSEKPLYPARKAVASFTNLCVSLKPGVAGEVVERGEWTLTFPVRYEDSSVPLISNATTISAANGQTYEFRNVSVSPIGVHLQFLTENPYGVEYTNLSEVLEESAQSDVFAVNTNTNLYRSTDRTSSIEAVLQEGTEVKLIRSEWINNIEWGYVELVETGAKGWIWPGPYQVHRARLEDVLNSVEENAILSVTQPVNLYPSTSRSTFPLDLLAVGDTVELLEREMIGSVEWGHVRSVETGTEGWISSEMTMLRLEQAGLSALTMQLRLKNGELIELDPSHSVMYNYNNIGQDMKLVYGSMFDLPISLSEMDALIICGEEFPITVQ